MGGMITKTLCSLRFKGENMTDKQAHKWVHFKKDFNVITTAPKGFYFTPESLKVPIKLWLSKIDDGALDQYYNLARLPFVFKHIAAMGDSHFGYGMPIGGVMATKGYIIPNAVGFDVGCGMFFMTTNLTEIDRDVLKKIMSDIRRLIPVGKKHQSKAQTGMPSFNSIRFKNSICETQYERAEKQLGTLGSGNHFIEIQRDQDDQIGIMLHSGSRNLGYRVADHYNKLAITKNEKWFSQVPKEWELAFLPLYDECGSNYFTEMGYCVEFAFANRFCMMEKVKEAFLNHIDVTFDELNMINIAHNYASIEHHFNQNVIVHRKGATAAFKDQLGIIPGSQGSLSYIVRGKGEPQSFMSCSHGAGRVMGRKKAQKTLNLEEEIKKLDDQGIIHSIRTTNDLEEATSAYKDIEDVMNHQTDLVHIEKVLRPLAVVKG